MRIDPPAPAYATRTFSAPQNALLAQSANMCASPTLAWVATNYGAGADPITSWGGVTEAKLRPPAEAAFGLAALVATGHFDPTAAGATESAVKQQAIRLATSLAATHKANSPTGWGGVPAVGVITPNSSTPEWQGAWWVGHAAAAALMLWDDLTGPQRTAVESMLNLEADRFLTYAVPSYRNRSGRINTPGDTKAEENAWNCWVPFLAAAHQPGHPNAPTWLTKGIELALGATATPAAPTSRHRFNGRTVGTTVTGSSIELDGYVVNHDLISPGYTTLAGTMAWVGGLSFAWKRGRIPLASMQNADRIYRAMVDLPVGGAPFYTPGSYLIWFPQGDEGAGQRMPGYVLFDGVAHVIGADVSASVPAATWLTRHTTHQLTMQNADPALREGYDLRAVSMALFAEWIVRTVDPTFSNAPVAALLA